MKLRVRFFFTAFLVIVLADSITNTAAAKSPDLLGILFYKTDCPECNHVIGNVLPAAFAETANNAGILAVNNSTPEGGQLFLELLMARNLSLSGQLPLLVTKKNAWSGQDEIKQNIVTLLTADPSSLSFRFKNTEELMTRSLKQKSDWFLQTAFWINKDVKPVQRDLWETFARNFRKDKTGNSVSVAVLLGMVVVLIYIAVQMKKKSLEPNRKIPVLFPVLCGAAFVIASYLFFSGFMQSEVSCGPVGDCNTVQQSSYARLFNLIPVSLLGMASFLTAILLWISARLALAPLKNYLTLAVWGISVFSVGFFVYLTFLEPFVIGATCIWCLTSAIITSLNALITTKPAQAALYTLPFFGADHQKRTLREPIR